MINYYYKILIKILNYIQKNLKVLKRIIFKRGKKYFIILSKTIYIVKTRNFL